MSAERSTPMSPERALVIEREQLIGELAAKREEHATAAKVADRANARALRLHEGCRMLEERLSAINEALGVLA